MSVNRAPAPIAAAARPSPAPQSQSRPPSSSNASKPPPNSPPPPPSSAQRAVSPPPVNRPNSVSNPPNSPPPPQPNRAQSVASPQPANNRPPSAAPPKSPQNAQAPPQPAQSAASRSKSPAPSQPPQQQAGRPAASPSPAPQQAARPAKSPAPHKDLYGPPQYANPQIRTPASPAPAFDININIQTFAETFECILPFEYRIDSLHPDWVAQTCAAILRYSATQRSARNSVKGKSKGKLGRSPSDVLQTSLSKEGKEGDGWRLGNANVFLSVEMRDWLEAAKVEAADGKKFYAIRVQKAFRGFRVRRKFKEILTTWRQLRMALSHALRAQFIQDYGDEDYVDNVSGVDELHAVNSFMKTMLLFAKREPTGDKSMWASERIAKEVSTQKTNILSVIQAKHTLKQVTGKDQTAILNLYDEKGVYVGPTSSAKEKVELLSYALQEARRLDLEVIRTAFASGLYLFDPALDDDGDECNIQSTPEFKQALHAFQTLRLVIDKLPAKLKRIAQSHISTKEVRNLVLSVDALQIGRIQEVENARQAVDRVEKLVNALDRSISEQNLPELKRLLEQAIQMKMTRPIVEKARVKALELDIRNTLQTGMNTNDVKQLAAAIQFCMDAVMEEGVRRKRRKQRKLRTKWIMKKKGANASDEEKAEADSPDDDRSLSLNVDNDIQNAQNFLRELMKANKDKSKAPAQSSAKPPAQPQPAPSAATPTPGQPRAVPAPAAPAPSLGNAIPLPNQKPAERDVQLAPPPSPPAPPRARPPSVPSSPPPPPHPDHVDASPNSAKSAQAALHRPPPSPNVAASSNPPDLSLTQPLPQTKAPAPPLSEQSRQLSLSASRLEVPIKSGEKTPDHKGEGHRRHLSVGSQDDPMDPESMEIIAGLRKQEEQALSQMLSDAGMALKDLEDEDDDDRSGERTPDRDRQGEISRPVSTASLEDGSGVLVGVVHPNETRNKGRRKNHAREAARLQIRTAVAKCASLLDLLHGDQDKRLRATDLLTDLPLNPNINPASVKGAELLQLKLTIEAALAAGSKVGIDSDFDRMNVKMDNLADFAELHGTTELSDFKDVTELQNCLIEVTDQLTDWKRVGDQIKEAVRLIAACADENNPSADLEKLTEKVRYVLQTARLAVLDEERIELLQAAYNALIARDASELAVILDDAMDFVERENAAPEEAKESVWPRSSLHEKNRAHYELSMSQSSTSLANLSRPSGQPQSSFSTHSLPNNQSLIASITATGRIISGSSSFAAPSAVAVANQQVRKAGGAKLGQLVDGNEEDKQSGGQSLRSAISAGSTLPSSQQGEASSPDPTSPVPKTNAPPPAQAKPAEKASAPSKSPVEQAEGPQAEAEVETGADEQAEAEAEAEKPAESAKKEEPPAKPVTTAAKPVQNQPSAARSLSNQSQDDPDENTTAGDTSMSFEEHRKRLERADSKNNRGQAQLTSEGDQSHQQSKPAAPAAAPVQAKPVAREAAKSPTAPSKPPSQPAVADKGRMADPPSIKANKPAPAVPSAAAVLAGGSVRSNNGDLVAPRDDKPLTSMQQRQQAALDKHKRTASNAREEAKPVSAQSQKEALKARVAAKKEAVVSTGKSVDRDMADTAELLFKISVPDEEEKRAVASGNVPDFPKANSIARKNLSEMRAIVNASIAAQRSSLAPPSSSSTEARGAPVTSSSGPSSVNSSPKVAPVQFEAPPPLPSIDENSNNTAHSAMHSVGGLSVHSDSTIDTGPPATTPAGKAREALVKSLGQATRLLRALMANLQAVSAYKDLVSKPAPNTPMRRGRVRDSDLASMKSKVESDLKVAFDYGLEEKSKEVADARNVLAEISVHEEERSAALSAVEQLLVDASKYPFATGDAVNEEMELYPQDETLHALRERVAETLQNARLVGIVEDYLTPLQDTYDDMIIYIAGRNEARAECEKLLKMVKTLYDAHPMMFKVEELEAAIAQHASENDFKNLESEPVDQADADLVGVADLLHATLNDTELVGIPTAEASIASCRSALTALRTYITARVAARQEIQALAEAPLHMMQRRRIRAALQFAKKTGLLNDDDIMKAQRHLGRGGQQIARSQTLRRIDLLAKRLVELEKTKKPVQQPNMRQKLEDLDRLDKKLTQMVPQARQRLAQAIKDKDPEALAAAIQQAKALELKLQKLREYRKQELQKMQEMGMQE